MNAGFYRVLGYLLVTASLVSAACVSETDQTIRESNQDVIAQPTSGSLNQGLVVTLDDGAECDSGEVCESGHCVDGVCCDTPCEGLCMACSNELTNEDSGSCMPVGVGTDPGNECEADSLNLCGQTGECGGTIVSSGESSCELAPTSVLCQNAACQSGDTYSAAYCNGVGACGNRHLVEQCGFFGCEGIARSFDFVTIESSSFTMGSPSTEAGRDTDETERVVTLTRSFLIADAEVTQRDWLEAFRDNPTPTNRDCLECPVEYVTFWEALSYANYLSVSEGLTPCYTLSGCSVDLVGTGRTCTDVSYRDENGAVDSPYKCQGYRLPSEAEWELAARATSSSASPAGANSSTNLDVVSWYSVNSANRAHPVRSKAPNGWGLFDMLGNTEEWVGDRYGTYTDAAVTDPIGAATGTRRVIRGGGWSDGAPSLRSGARAQHEESSRAIDLGFRVARTLSEALPQPSLQTNGASAALTPNFVRLSPGTFSMGAQPSYPSVEPNQEPVHSVTLTHFFEAQTHEVTQGQFSSAFVINPSSHYDCVNCPVENVSFWDALHYANDASLKEGYQPCYELHGCSGVVGVDRTCTSVTLSGAFGRVAKPQHCEGYRLPTEAEWEYLARAGAGTAFSNGRDTPSSGLGWSSLNATETKAIKTRSSNALGIYDVHGNVREWVWDRIRDNAADDRSYANAESFDPVGPLYYRMNEVSYLAHAVRGGSYLSDPDDTHLAYRDGELPDTRTADLGFRLVRSLPFDDWSSLVSSTTSPECSAGCSSDDDCDASTGSWCQMATQTCVQGERDGQACERNSECGSGQCVDGVCCASQCDAGCFACIQGLTGQASGICAPVLEGMPRGGDCLAGAASECGLDGTCNGQGECRFYQETTVCVGAACVAGDAVGDRFCNGAGMCTEPVSYDACEPFACDGRSAECRTLCGQDADCASGVLPSGRREFRCHDSSGECTDQAFVGEVCSEGSQCVSGHCVDGVCCDSACDSLCESCLQNETGIQNGTCSPIVAGTDPGAECAQQPRSSCGTAGYCDGAGACSLYSSSTVCLGAYCDGDDRLNSSRCDGAGVCLEPTNRRSCAPYTCAGSSCLSNCDGNEDCASGFRCQTSDSVCTDLSFIGESCGADTQCYSGQCVDGVCCESACEGECLACSQSKTGEANGLCRNVSLGSDPDNECRDDGAPSCGLNGACGAGGCALYASGTECASETCIGDDLYGVRRCDGSGTCAEARDLVQDCGPYSCSGQACLTTCSSDSACSDGYRCATSDGVCTDQAFQGETCGSNGRTCYAGSCVDGVCCENACGGTCEACVGSKTGQNDGVCAPIVAGGDPDNECSRDDVATCGSTGVCDGARACAVYPASATCLDAYCSGDTRFAVSRCDGSGTCGAPESSTSCAPYTCSGGGCLNSCGSSGDCASGYRCQTADRVCTTKRFKGESCSGASQCYSGYCVDGVCCDQQCGGTCMACDGAQTGTSAGTCSAVLDGQSTGECSTQAASSCGYDGTCNGAGGCALYDSGTECGAAACSSGTIYNPRACNGSGNCLAPTINQDCGLFNCYTSGASALCYSSCSSDAHCDSAAGAWCNTQTNRCVTGKRPGESCSPGECGTGVCNDGVCCQTSCDGTCYSCNGSYTGVTSGVCAPVTSGRSWGDCSDQGAFSCGQNGTCNGAGSCSRYNSSTTCGQAQCSGGDVYAAALCNGSGTCRAPVKSQECGDYACSNTSCLTSCTSNVHCASGRRCYTNRLGGGNVCTSKKLNGESCSNGSQCASNQCVDGVCCESGCGGTCEACNQAKTGQPNGYCSPIRSGNDYDNECADQTCSGDLRYSYSASTCSNRSCSSQSVTDCGAYKCNPSTNACRTSCSSASDCQSGTPYCLGGVCTSNTPPSCSNQNFSVNEMSSVNVNLSGSDSDGDALTFHTRYASGVNLSWRNQSSGALSLAANTCGDNGSFQFYVRDSKGSTSGWCSVSVSVNNVRPSLSTNGNKSGGYGAALQGYADFSDCGNEANCNRASVWKHSGSGTISKTSCSGTRVYYSWQPNRASEGEFCNGPTANHRRQDAQARVQISDGRASRTRTVSFTAAAAQKCDDQCVSRPWYLLGACGNDEVLPAGCGYCQPNTRQERYLAREWQTCWNENYRDCWWATCRGSWGIPYLCRKCGWKTRRRCTTHREYAYRTVNTGDTSCNDQSSAWGLLSSAWNWILEVLGFSNPGPWCLR